MSTIALILGNLDLILGVASALLGADALHALPKSVRFVLSLFKTTPANEDLVVRMDKSRPFTPEELGRLTDEERALVMHSRGS